MISGQMSGATGLKDKKKRRKANVLAAPAPSKKNNKKKGAKLNKNDAKEEKFDNDLVFAYMITRSRTLVLSLSRDLFAFFLLIHSLAQLRFHVFICLISHTHVFYLF